ncbi:4Fe-4S binding protein [Parabacteroides sp. FAFU027]|uniref:4Fe-4S binding protein n=1 Tax=Parabacteroides sp. FAFU027 TaxID=2922715 RepID=UPI001FAEE19B|nr:4Fe-4S binding protein [Parabacteroides sp. FAFU027]
MKTLKHIRRLLAILFFLPILLFFIDFTGLLPLFLHKLLQMQWIPALMSVQVGVVGFLLVLSLLFGRLYCSVICPLGVFQDIAAWKSRWFKKKGRRYRFDYRKPNNILRYSLLALTVIVFLLGSSAVVVWLDPYSIFGRIITQLLRPLFIWANNGFSALFIKKGIYVIYGVSQNAFVVIPFIITSVFFVIVAVMSWFRGRLYCNTVCPVGTFLGLLSKLSLFKIEIEKSSCTQCSACEKRCKSQCIDSMAMTVDETRCVSCFNCLSVCKKGGVKYAFRYGKKQEAAPVSEINSSRRTFMLTSGAVVAALATAKAETLTGKKDEILSRKPIMPPGAGHLEHFNTKCTGCQLCVSKCPMHVLKPAALEYGISGIMQPRLAFSTHVYCNQDCTICSEVCPTGALTKLTVEEKRVTQMGIARFRKHKCVVYTDEKDCGACSEHCPTQAVHMIPYKNGLTIPQVTPDLCIGCGGCESICPVRPYQAIYVEGNSVQVKAKKPKDAQKFEKKIDNFGF